MCVYSSALDGGVGAWMKATLMPRLHPAHAGMSLGEGGTYCQHGYPNVFYPGLLHSAEIRVGHGVTMVT